VARSKDRMFGVEDPLVINELVFLSTNVLYKCFLFNRNIGEVDYDLVTKYKISLRGVIFIHTT